MMLIYLMRHGDYHLNKDNNDVLTPKGIQQIESLSQFLLQSKISITEILHSEKNRAKQTASIIAHQLGSNKINEKTLISPNDDPSSFLAELSIYESGTLVVTHLPYVGRLLSHLVLGQDEVDIVDFQPSTFVALTQTRRDKWLISFVWMPNNS
jgi:phosphohistidine phosphatase